MQFDEFQAGDFNRWIIHRDDRIVAVNKPSGMIVHRGWDNDAVTLADIVRDKMVKGPVHAVHRLDRGTSGIVIFALDSEAARILQERMQSGRLVKKYLALVRGPMREPIRLDHAIPARKGGERVAAVTVFEPLALKDRWSLIEATPLTGRLHQIRRHLKHLSHPIVGDVRYGKGDVNRYFREYYNLCRLALHCCCAQFEHVDGVALNLEASLPDDLATPLTALGVWPSPSEPACI